MFHKKRKKTTFNRIFFHQKFVSLKNVFYMKKKLFLFTYFFHQFILVTKKEGNERKEIKVGNIGQIEAIETEGKTEVGSHGSGS